MAKLNAKNSTTKAVGRRKAASARVRIDKGSGEITVNGKKLAEYFGFFDFQRIAMEPLKTLGKEKDLDISAKVTGGGIKGQAEAVRHGIARALVRWNEDFRKVLKAEGLLSRDPRVKERKKPGLKKARRAPQWSKR